jgi:two-component system chemotaxis response regulator CheY
MKRKKTWEKLRVLLVDDNPTDLLLEKVQLERLDIRTVHEARNGEEAWLKIDTSLASETLYDLIITDWKMPRKNGLSLVEELQSHRRLAKIPVVLLTGVSEEEQVKKALKQKIADYILKPVKLDVLEAKLKKIVG